VIKLFWVAIDVKLFLLERNLLRSFMWRITWKQGLTDQPVLYWLLIRILIVKQPSPSEKPVTNQGLIFYLCAKLFLRESLQTV